MVMFAIGEPGGPARITECEPDRLAAKLRAGEVAVEIEAFSPGRLSEDGASFVPHVADLAELKAARREVAKRVRRKRTAQGVSLAGFGIAQTDSAPGRDSLAAIHRKAAKAMRQPAEQIPFKFADNVVRDLTAAEMIELADIADAHEQACRDACEEILALIDAAADEAALDAINIMAGYPALPE